jgi:hypothetical protein
MALGLHSGERWVGTTRKHLRARINSGYCSASPLGPCQSRRENRGTRLPTWRRQASKFKPVCSVRMPAFLFRCPNTGSGGLAGAAVPSPTAFASQLPTCICSPGSGRPVLARFPRAMCQGSRVKVSRQCVKVSRRSRLFLIKLRRTAAPRIPFLARKDPERASFFLQTQILRLERSDCVKVSRSQG